MRPPFLLTALLLLLPALAARAGEPLTVARAGFSAQLWTVEGHGFLRDWKAGRRDPTGATTPPCPELTRGDAKAGPLLAAVTFAGSAADELGLAHVRYDLRVLRPDGSVYARQPDALGLRGWAGPGRLFPQLGRVAISLVPERGDPPGFYLVEAQVRDVVAGVELPVLRASFLVR